MQATRNLSVSFVSRFNAVYSMDKWGTVWPSRK